MAIKALDISKHQGTFNPDTAKSQGINTVIIRAAYGTSKDKKFDEFTSKCKAAGLRMGAYVFMTCHYKNKCNSNIDTAISLMEQQVDAMLNIIKGANITSWVALDQELEANCAMGLSIGDNTKLLNKAADRVRNAGYEPCLYCSASWLKANVHIDKLNMPIWAAYYPRYSYGPDFNEMPNYPDSTWGNYLRSLGSKICMWQFGSVNHGHKYGAGSTNIDRNWVYSEPEGKKDNPMTFNPLENKQLIVTEKVGNKRQAFATPDVNDSKYLNLPAGTYRLSAIGEYKMITDTMGGTWYKLTDVTDTPYVIVLDGRSDLYYVEDIPAPPKPDPDPVDPQPPVIPTPPDTPEEPVKPSKYAEVVVTVVDGDTKIEVTLNGNDLPARLVKVAEELKNKGF